MAINLDLPTNWELTNDDGTRVKYSELTDAQIHELAAAFLELLFSLRDRERMH